MITDVEGILSSTLKAVETEGWRAVVTGLEDIPTLIVDADRLIGMVGAMLSHARRQADRSCGALTVDAAYDRRVEQLHLRLSYKTHHNRKALDQALDVMLTGGERWRAAPPPDVPDEDAVDDLPGPPDLADMAWCALIAAAMGGALERVISPAEGTTILRLSIMAPVARDTGFADADDQDALDPEDPLIAVSSGLGLRPKMVLLIEDAAIASRLVGDYLQQLGHQVHIVDRGEAAIDAVEQVVFDLVLLDLTLPDMTGWEVIEHLKPYRERGQLGAVYAFTASDDSKLPARIARAGFDGLLTKPVDWNQLRLLLRDPTGDSRDPLAFQKAGYVDAWPDCRAFPVIDMTVQQELVEIMGEQALAQLHGDFRHALDDYAADLLATAAGTADDAWRQTCHNMKSIAGSMGAMRLSQMAHVLTHHGWPDDATDAARLLRETIQATRDSLSV